MYRALLFVVVLAIVGACEEEEGYLRCTNRWDGTPVEAGITLVVYDWDGQCHFPAGVTLQLFSQMEDCSRCEFFYSDVSVNGQNCGSEGNAQLKTVVRTTTTTTTSTTKTTTANGGTTGVSRTPGTAIVLGSQSTPVWSYGVIGALGGSWIIVVVVVIGALNLGKVRLYRSNL